MRFPNYSQPPEFMENAGKYADLNEIMLRFGGLLRTRNTAIASLFMFTQWNLSGSVLCCAQTEQPWTLTPPAQNVLVEPPGLQAGFETPLAFPVTEETFPVPEVVVLPTADSTDSDPNSEWWHEGIQTAFRPNASFVAIDIDTLFYLTAMHSDRVQAIADKVNVQLARIDQAESAFIPTLYSDSRYDSTSDPVQNTLTTGGPPRLEDAIVGIDAGLRGQGRFGTQYNLGQRLGHKNSNSLFFDPNDQGSSRLFANVTQPLLRGREIDGNRTLVLTARFESSAAQAEYLEALQTQLFKVADTYWTLYTERASFVQRKRHLERANEIAELLTNRQGHDVSRSQVLRAQSTIANREADIAQADARIRNLEAQIRALTNAPEFTEDRSAEFVPMQRASLRDLVFDTEEQVAQALRRRPELDNFQNQLSAAQSRLRLAKDQLKPTLNLVGEGYLAGLRGDSDIPGAWIDQFRERPGYAAGIVFERPANNRGLQAAIRQYEFEIAQINHALAEAKENIRAEVETAIRNFELARQVAESRQRSLSAVNAEVEFLYDRWRSLGNDPKLGQLQLDELLRAQDRLLQEEQNLLQALVQYNKAIPEVQRATGVLIRFAPGE